MINAAQRLLAFERQSDGVANALFKALRPLDPSMKPPKMRDTSAGMNYTFIPASKLTLDSIVKSLTAIEGAVSSGKSSVVFTTTSKIGVVYEEEFKIIYNEDPEAKIFNVLHLN